MIGFPFDSHVTFESDGTPVYDRAISSAPYRKLIKKLFTTGVMPTESTNMQVTPSNGMTIAVLPGFAVVEGCMKLEEATKVLTLSAASASSARIDTIVLRLDDNDAVRTCEYAVVTGTPSAEPVAPSLTREGSIYEIGLADILVPRNSTEVSAARITDTRYNAERCGVISSVSEFDSSTIYDQVQADLAEFKADEQIAFVEWFQNLRNQLDDNQAAHLQNEIDSLERESVKWDNVTESTNVTEQGFVADARAIKAIKDKYKTMSVYEWATDWFEFNATKAVLIEGGIQLFLFFTTKNQITAGSPVNIFGFQEINFGANSPVSAHTRLVVYSNDTSPKIIGRVIPDSSNRSFFHIQFGETMPSGSIGFVGGFIPFE